jgi:uncharacterized protein (DUF697 family)
MPVGLGLRDVAGLVQEVRRGAGEPRHIVVSGPGAAELAAALASDGDPSRVRVGGDAAGAAALVRVVEGEPTAADEAALRAATRAGAHLVALVRAQPAPSLPYVLAEDVVTWPVDAPLPVDQVVQALVRGLGATADDLAAMLPRLRDAVVRRDVLTTSVAAATLVGFARGSGAMMPVLTMLQARMLRRVRTACGEKPPTDPQGIALAAGPNLAAAVATGLVCRSLSRRLPVRGRLVGSAIAFAGTTALGTAARRFLPQR